MRILYGMTTEEEPNWAMITDDELERTVREIRELIPNIGQAQARRKHQKIVGGGGAPVSRGTFG